MAVYEEVSPRHRKCAMCGKTMGSRMGLWSHLKDKHKVESPAAEHFLKAGRQHKNDSEPSFASRAIDAQLDHAMGIANDDYDWLVQHGD